MAVRALREMFKGTWRKLHKEPSKGKKSFMFFPM